VLNKKQKRFCQEYIIDLNATQAAIRAGYSEKTAGIQSFHLLKKPNIQSVIQKALENRSIRTQITQDRVLEELARIGFSCVDDYVEWGGSKYKLKESQELTDDQKAAISEVSVHKSKDGGSIKFKLYDKVSALEKIGRHLGMFNDKIDVNMTINSWDDLEKELSDKPVKGKQ
jgi:phage terminase small subunit